ncbi:MAG: hypothetical protein AUG49_14625 [Catenulispora sp. 13_1_20CM_3_70_7]|nr:MAG: hypothetical protein AUG49_14625 [Catenulispora sp. 13_1_20CM_3_70_7]
MTARGSTTTGTLIGSTRAQLGRLFEAGTVTAAPHGRSRGTVLLGTGGFLARCAAALTYAG